MIQHLNARNVCRITFRELEIMFPPIRDENTILKFKPIITSSEERFKKWCSENKYFYEYDINNNTYLISK